ncbi:hypothetical protein ACFTXJ_14285 [Streptomyces zhihengii]|uniref:hypothetical protein n=1 Tax=Streptomyces zhihengii TaxID=1818004 RepID=UPI003645AE39
MSEPLSEDGLLLKVAALWHQAAEANVGRIARIRAAYPDRSERTIQRWIAEARRAGLVPPTKPGSNALRTPQVEAVAEALGVSYASLVIAIREHAHGYLRIGSTEEEHARATLT